MDVLELPRPVINFLRTMSKEMHRYSLCWDIYGGTENVTLTLTWKLNCDDSSDSGEARSETKSPKSPRKAKKQAKQLQHSRLDTLKTCSRFLTDKRNAQSDYKQQQCEDLNPYYYTKDKLLDASISSVYSGGSNTPIKNSHKICDKRRPRGKSLEINEKKEPSCENKLDSIKRDTIPLSKFNLGSDPWIRRDSFDKNVNRSDIDKEVKLMSLIETITGEENTPEPKSQSVSVTNNAGPCFKINSGNHTNTGTNFSSSSKMTNGASNTSAGNSKVTFDPNLEYI
ncbi:hypothetical protein BpHYR1_018524 [Brachionus plicatilis]|uniref:Uncharacterized protein n=1 Tax=Brachionus plicatilis TaxID=10195 RepID=A0A3M7RTD6_BRAPC|nr:hypothetical protein BpHYR1_018524 [Brachionus plicatilis]